MYVPPVRKLGPMTLKMERQTFEAASRRRLPLGTAHSHETSNQVDCHLNVVLVRLAPLTTAPIGTLSFLAGSPAPRFLPPLLSLLLDRAAEVLAALDPAVDARPGAETRPRRGTESSPTAVSLSLWGHWFGSWFGPSWRRG